MYIVFTLWYCSMMHHEFFTKRLCFFMADNSILIFICCIKPLFELCFIKLYQCTSRLFKFFHENISGFFFINSSTIISIKLCKNFISHLHCHCIFLIILCFHYLFFLIWFLFSLLLFSTFHLKKIFIF